MPTDNPAPLALLKRAYILIVEDEEIVLTHITGFLKRRVRHIYTATNGKLGLELFKQYRPQIVITDINMPEMNGLEMAEIIRSSAPDIPIVVITAYNDQDYFIKAIELGIDKYILKPVETERLLNTLLDIVEKLNAKREIEMMRKHLEDSMRLQSVAQLTKGVAHNFNNILVGIMGYAGLMRMRLSEADWHGREEILKYIDTIERSADRASELTKRLMAFSGKTQLEKQDTSINEVVEQALELFTVPKDINLEISLSEGPLPIQVDRDKMAQVLVNMCINAIEAMPEGGAIKIETFQEESNGVIRITDTGIGMDEETVRRVFEPFFTTKGLATHLGLGLSTSNTTVKDHGGFIKVHSNLGHGSEFKIYLPLAKEKA